MQTTENKSFTLIGFLSSKMVSETRTEPEPDRFYQQIVSLIIKSVNAQIALTDLGDRLLAIAEHAYTFRRMDAVESISELLINLSLPTQYKSAGYHYKALCIKRRGRFDEARLLFEGVVKEAKPWFRIRAMMGAGTIAVDSGDLSSALSLYIEAMRAASQTLKFDPLIALNLRRMIAIIKGNDGDHSGALEDLESMFPLARAVGSQYLPEYYAYLNSLAVEMMEVGRLEEAENVSNIVVASPFAKAYPEWRETKDEIAVKRGRRSGSVVAINREAVAEDCPSASVQKIAEPVAVSEICEDVVLPKEKTPPPESRSISQPASVLLFPVRNRQYVKQPVRPSKITIAELRRMTLPQKRTRILELVYDEQTPEEVYDEMLEASGLVIAQEEWPKELDFDTPGALEETIRLWVNGELTPEKFAAVMSALRDCDDELRRIDIMDRMISYAFSETREAMKSEDDWRNRVESQLKPEAY